jgi:eukaryotic-like serine/threonine-protein kinase
VATLLILVHSISTVYCDARVFNLLPPPALTGCRATRKMNQPGRREFPAMIDQIISHYRIVEKIGGGGMGVVYKAEDTRLHRFVALKFLPDAVARHPQALARFQREAQAASALNHPNICTIYDFGEENGRAFIAMELLEGRSLDEEIRGKRPSLSRLLEIGIELANGLDAAHAKGIIHRDIKPANLFLANQGQLKILDFGLAKLTPVAESNGSDETIVATAPEKLSSPGAAIGTVSYMSPEQASGEDLDTRTDLFSAGAVLYEFASGHTPFPGKTTVKAFDFILNREPASLQEIDPSLPADMVKIIGKCLEKDRELRYQHASDLRTDLKRVKRDLSSGRHSSAERTSGKLDDAETAARRRPRLAVSGAVALLLLAVLLVGGYLWVSRPSVPKPEPTERQLTANPPEAWVMSAAISPDGKSLAYNDQTGLFVRTIETGETHAVSLPKGFHERLWGIQWFPEGGKLLGTVAAANVSTEMWSIAIVGSAPPRLVRPAAWAQSISPDGKAIAFSDWSRGPKEKELWVCGINGDVARKLVAEEAAYDLSSAVWSPDSRWIAYFKSPKWNSKAPVPTVIEVRPAGGGPAKTLFSESSLPRSTLTGEAGGLAWLPDWRLVFSVREAPATPALPAKGSLWFIPVKRSTADAGKPARLAGGWEDILPQNLAASADGRFLTFTKVRITQDVYVGELAKEDGALKAARRLTLVNGENYPGAWTRDGQSIFFSSNRNHKWEIFRQELDKNTPDLVISGQEDSSGAKLTPDGAGLLYSESEATESNVFPSWRHLMRAPVNGGPSEKVMELSSKDWAYQGFRCPHIADLPCVLSQREEKAVVFYSLDPIRGKGAELGKIEVPEWGMSLEWGVSPDGSRIAYVAQKEMIRVLTLSDHAWHDISVEPGQGELQSITWVADGKGWFATSWLPESFNMLHVTLAGKVSTLIRNKHGQGIYGPLASPDSKRLAYQAQTWDSNVWMLENF